MRRSYLPALAILLLGALLLAGLAPVHELVAQPPGILRQRQKQREQRREKKDETPRLPNDPRLLQLHKDFVTKAERLAREYEKKKQYDKARAVCEEILKLVPRYPVAMEMLTKIEAIEATAERVTFDIHADQGWQDTGVVVQAGKPLAIVAKGSWTFNMSHELTAEGMEIPKVLRDFKLGSLIGIIGSGTAKDVKPFYVGSAMQIKPEKSGRLFLRMHDSDPKDNSGRLNIEIRGTFEKAPR